MLDRVFVDLQKVVEGPGCLYEKGDARCSRGGQVGVGAAAIAARRGGGNRVGNSGGGRAVKIHSHRCMHATLVSAHASQLL
jgi:hypothetical protein